MTSNAAAPAWLAERPNSVEAELNKFYMGHHQDYGLVVQGYHNQHTAPHPRKAGLSKASNAFCNMGAHAIINTPDR